MRLIFSIIIASLIASGWTALALSTGKSFGIHPSDIWIGGPIVAFIAWYVWKNINNTVGISFMISWAVTGWAIWYGFSPSTPEHSLIVGVGIAMVTWLLTVSKVIPSIVALLIGGVLYASRNRMNKI
jgi:hypothetical protein